MRTRIIIVLMLAVVAAGAGLTRYPVGKPVPVEIYTAAFDPCDPGYKFFQTRYGDPNDFKLQSAPDGWIKTCGDNERTMILHTISELRVAVISLSRQIKAQKDPNNGPDL
jgi:hypothetical protein